MKNERFENTEQKPDVIAGRNPVSEAVRSNRPIDKILVAKGEKSGAIVGILAKARDKKIPVKEVDRTKLDYVSGGATHQGIVALQRQRIIQRLTISSNMPKAGAKLRLLLCLMRLKIRIISVQ